MSKYSEIEGAVNVNGDMTPITRKPIEQIDSSEWHKLSTAQLHDQRIVLQNRMYSVANLPNGAAMYAQMQKGLAQLDAIIATRTKDNIELI